MPSPLSTAVDFRPQLLHGIATQAFRSCAAAFLVLFFAPEVGSATPPNVVVIVTDDRCDEPPGVPRLGTDLVENC